MCDTGIMSRYGFIFILMMIVLSMPLAGCGVKPASVDPPPGAENDVFPNTYPHGY